MSGEADPLGRQKDAAESKWQRALLQFWQGQLERIERKLTPGIPKSRKAIEDLPKRLDKDFWDAEDRELLAILLPLFVEEAEEAAELFAEWTEEEIGIGVDWALINIEAVKWARDYSFKLVKGIDETTQKQLRQYISAWIETPGATMGDLFGKLAGLSSFGSKRARMIAVTEVTRAYAEGNRASAKVYEDEGLLTWVRTWETNNDGLVCDLCIALHNKTAEGTDGPYPDGSYSPPRHPRCILPGNEIVVPGPISAAAKSFYIGQCVEVRLADGRGFTVTQNHPILTPKG